MHCSVSFKNLERVNMNCQDKLDFLHHHYLASQLNVESDIIDVVDTPSPLLWAAFKHTFPRVYSPEWESQSEAEQKMIRRQNLWINSEGRWTFGDF